VVRNHVETEFLPELALKGKAQVVQVYRVKGGGGDGGRRGGV
jgi:hypothetical protein